MKLSRSMLFWGVLLSLTAVFSTMPSVPAQDEGDRTTASDVVDRETLKAFVRGNQMALDFAHFGNGDSFSSDLVLVNLAATPIQPLVYFYGKDGELIDPGSMVDIMGNLETTEFGALTIQSELPPGGEITISTNGMGDLTTGSVKVVTEGLDSPIGGVLRFDAPGIGVAGVGASQAVRDAIIPVRRQMGGIDTGAALRNLSESELTLTCRLMMGGEMLEMQTVTLPANGQTAMFISELFEHDTSDFAGSLRCTAPAGEQEFTGVAVELDANNRIFTTLPVIPLSTDVSSDGTAPAPSQTGRVVVAGADARLGDDDYVLNSATITGDTLTVSVSYSGGCRTHVFTLVIAASFVEDSPVRLPAVLRHDANGDPCEAFLTESYVSISPWSGHGTGRSTGRARAGLRSSSTAFPRTVWSTSSRSRPPVTV